MRRDEFTQLSTKVLQPRLACLGLIKIGGKGEKQKKNGKEWYRPTKYDHFKITKRDRGSDGNYVLDKAVHDVIGTMQPRELDIRFLFNEVHENFQTSLTAYEGRSLRCKGNGERAFDRVLGRDIPCTCPLLKQHVGDYPADIVRPAGVACKPYGVLSVLLEAAQTYGGFHVLRTTSWESVNSITAALELFKLQFGLLSFVPFKLVIYPRSVVFEQGGQEKQGTSYSVSVVLNASMDTAFQIAGAAREKHEAALQLTSGSYTPERHAEQLSELAAKDEAEIGDEFHPQTIDAEIILEEEEDPVEKRIRRALELSGLDKLKINNKLAKYSERMGELAMHVEEHFPDHWKTAGDELAAAADQDVEIVPELVEANKTPETNPEPGNKSETGNESGEISTAVPASRIGDLFEDT